MHPPVQVVFRNMDRMAAIEEAVLERTDLLERFAGQIISCRVIIEPAGKHHRHGNQYRVHLDVNLPGREIVAGHAPPNRAAHGELSIAIRDAFDAARRQIEDYVRRRRGDVKWHEAVPRARVSRLVPEEDHGFLTTPDGREIFFHRNSVLNDRFSELQPGCEVTFVEEEGEQGPQASTVRVG